MPTVMFKGYRLDRDGTDAVPNRPSISTVPCGGTHGAWDREGAGIAVTAALQDQECCVIGVKVRQTGHFAVFPKCPPICHLQQVFLFFSLN